MICLIALSREQQAQWSYNYFPQKMGSSEELRQIREMIDTLENQKQ